MSTVERMLKRRYGSACNRNCYVCSNRVSKMVPARVFGCAVVLLLGVLAAVPGMRGMEIPLQAKDTVAFISATAGTNEVPDGTGFFVMVHGGTNSGFGYLVT